MDIQLNLQMAGRFLRYIGSLFSINGYDLFEWVTGFLLLALSYYIIKALVFYLGKSFGFSWFEDRSGGEE